MITREEYRKLTEAAAMKLRQSWRNTPGTHAATPRGYPFPLRSWPPDAAIDIQLLAEALDTDVATIAPNRILWTGTGNASNNFPGGPGTADLYTFGPTTTWPYPVKCFLNSIVYFGQGSGPINASTDIVPLATGTPVVASPPPSQAIAGAYFPLPLIASWTVPAFGNVQCKSRILITAVSGTCYTQSFYGMTIYPT